MLKRLVFVGVISLVMVFCMTKICSATVISEEAFMSVNPGYSQPLDTGEVVFQFNTPCIHSDGMAWDGDNLWITNDSLDVIWKYDTLGNLLDSIPAPGRMATGLTWDGQNLWCADHQRIRIYKLDPSTGNILDSIPAPGTRNSCEGLAWMNDTIWNTNWSDNIVWALDPSSGSIYRQFTGPGPSSTGLAWDSLDNCLWNSDQQLMTIFKLAFDGSVITQFSITDDAIQDLAFDGTSLWSCGYNSGNVYKYDILGIEEGTQTPESFVLVQSYPNPMHLKTEIMYQLPNKSKVSLNIYDITGQLIRTLVNENKSAGHHKAVWDSKDDYGAVLPSGVYYYRFETESYTATEKLILLK